MIHRRSAFTFTTVCAALFIIAAQATAQATPYTLSQVLELVRASVPSSLILARTKSSCINFKMTAENERIISGDGGDAALIRGLRASCYKGTEAFVTKRDNKIPRAVTHDTVITHDTIVVAPTSPNATLARTAYVLRDFRYDRSAASRDDPACDRRYVGDAYSITTKQVDFPCQNLWSAWLPAEVRVEGTLTCVSAADSPSFSWGISVGFDSVAHSNFTFEINGVGAFEVSHTEEGETRTVIPFQRSAAIHTGTNVPNTFAVEVRGRALKFFINGTTVGSYVADYPVQGKIGAGIFSSVPSGSVLIHNIRADQVD